MELSYPADKRVNYNLIHTRMWGKVCNAVVALFVIATKRRETT